MFLVCVDNRAISLADHQRPRGDLDNTVYPVTPGKAYPVLGMALLENVLYVLAQNDWAMPDELPAGLFDLGTWEMPSGWMFGLCSGIRASGKQAWVDPCGAVWGYAEYACDPTHGTRLLEREEDALKIFADRVREAEEADVPGTPNSAHMDRVYQGPWPGW